MPVQNMTKQVKSLYSAMIQANIQATPEYWDGHKHIDIAVLPAKLYIEVDGMQHLTDPKQILADFDREHFSDTEGYRTIHISNIVIDEHLNEVVKAISRVIELRVQELLVYSDLIQKATNFAIKIHESDVKKKRKGKDIPYITHPLSVGLILARVTQEVNIIAAGILHDTIEDCEPYGSVTKELLENAFNTDIARMVNDVSEQNKSLSWFERKMEALEHVKHMHHDSLLVKSADVLQNLVELNQDITAEGMNVFTKFNATKEETVLRYQKLIPEIRLAWADNPLLRDLEYSLNNLIQLTK